MAGNPSLPPLTLSPFTVPSIPSSPARPSPVARSLSYPQPDSPAGGPAEPPRSRPSLPALDPSLVEAGVQSSAGLPHALSETSSLALSADGSASTVRPSLSSTDLATDLARLRLPHSSAVTVDGLAAKGRRLQQPRIRTSTAGRYLPRSDSQRLQADDLSDEEEYDSDDALRRRSQGAGASALGLGPAAAVDDDDDEDERPEVNVVMSPRPRMDGASSEEEDGSSGLSDDDQSVTDGRFDDHEWPSDPPALPVTSGQLSFNQIPTSQPSYSLDRIASLDGQAIAAARAQILGAAAALVTQGPASSSEGLGFGDVEDESGSRFGRSDSQRSDLAQLALSDTPVTSSIAPPALSTSRKDAAIKIAVAGRPGAGKSTLITRAFMGWPLSAPSMVAPGVEMRTARPELKSRIPQLVQLYEVDSSRLTVGDDDRPRMPAECGDLEALIVCFDAGDQTSLQGIVELCRLRETGIPFLVFACKAGGAPRPKEVDIASLAAQIGRLIEISLERDATREQKGKGKYHQAFSFLLREAYNRRHGTYSPLPPTPGPVKPGDQTINHPAMRSAPGLSVQTDADHGTGKQPAGPGPRDSGSSLFSTASQQRLANEVLYHHPSSSSTSSLRLSRDSPVVVTPGDSIKSSWIVDDDWQGSQHSFPAKAEAKERDRNGNLMFFTLSELLAQLWLNAFTGELRNFHRFFFWSYRRFARPRDVLRFILAEMVKLDGKELAGTYAQLKWCSIVAWWIENHPRDFAAPGTKAAFDDLYDAIEDRPHLCHFGDKFLPFAYHLDELVPEELPWAVPDVDDELSPGPGHAALNTTEETPAGVLISTTTTVSYGPSSSTSVDNLQRTSQSAQRSTSSIASGSRPSSVPLRDRHDSETSRRSAGSMGNSSAAPSSIDKPLAQTASNGSGSAQTSAISAPSLGPSGLADVWESRAVSRLVSRFNELPDLQIASDITRLVWRYFERVEPRDVLTHVLSGSCDGHDSPVGRAMRHFYDVSAVFDDLSNLFVLLVYSQAKTKARARMYERVVRIIVLLRTQNNYIALLSGMTALSDVWMGRLRVTKELAQEALERAGDVAVLKKFQSHGRLVDNRQNYKTYRLAVREDEAAKRPAIPLVPVILADVNRAAQIEGVRKTDGAIVWSKYDKLGSILLAMVDYQARGCPVGPGTGPNAVEALLRDKPDIEERILYRRCDVLAAEEQNGNAIASAFRKYFRNNHD